MKCVHCGSPSLGNPCWYLLNHPEQEQRAWRESGADAPCQGDLYDIGQRELRDGRPPVMGIVLTILIVGICSIVYALL